MESRPSLGYSLCMSKDSKKWQSWGRVDKVQQEAIDLTSRHQNLPDAESSSLPYGMGRSYGDSCLNEGGQILVTQKLDKIISFDRETGHIRCESGMSLAELLEIIVPAGWFLPVSPGTKFITVGGAVANDVHGKNHHHAGNFGHHVLALELLRSDGQRLRCSPHKNNDWFYASIGGMGLTGLVTWVEFQLKKINNPYIEAENIKFENVDEFFDLCAESDRGYEYTVSWIDCLASGKNLGRGIFMRGNPAGPDIKIPRKKKSRKLTMPVDAPEFVLGSNSVRLFNKLFYAKQFRKRKKFLSHYEPFFYPLDSIHQWNRLYGKRGFFQYQCVVPYENSREPIRRILKEISKSGEGSLLAVLKIFGEKESLGMLSFPRKGVTLALDFANKGDKTESLFAALDVIVQENGGALYPAKDGRMPAKLFQQSYPRWQEFKPFIDPQFSSSFWRRVTKGK